MRRPRSRLRPRENLEADDSGPLRRLFGLIVGLLDHCTLLERCDRRGWTKPARLVAYCFRCATKSSTICLMTLWGNSIVSLFEWIAVTVPLPNIGCEI
jgi:hypothetical protein